MDVQEEGEEYYKLLKKLKEIKSADGGWITYFINTETNEKWVREYPHGDYHGGGSAILRRLEHFPWEEEKV
jgi:Immunity protein 27